MDMTELLTQVDVTQGAIDVWTMLKQTNNIDLIFGALTLLFTLSGYKKGFLKMITKAITVIGAFVLSFAFVGKAAAFLLARYDIIRIVNSEIVHFLTERVGDLPSGGDIPAAMSGFVQVYLANFNKFGLNMQDIDVSFIRDIPMVDSSTYIQIIANNLTVSVTPFIMMVVNGLAFIGLLLLFYIILHIVTSLLASVLEGCLRALGLSRVLNNTLGGVVGLLHGVFISFLILGLLYGFLLVSNASLFGGLLTKDVLTGSFYFNFLFVVVSQLSTLSVDSVFVNTIVQSTTPLITP